METLVVVAQHRNQYNKGRFNAPARFGSLDSPHSRDFHGVNCRNFQSGIGILPTPVESCNTPVIRRASSLASPKTPVNTHSDNNKHLKRAAKSGAVPIPINLKHDSNKDKPMNDEIYYSERWAGPAYSNSPPPSSLPIPKFSLPPKRTVSLELPTSPSGFGPFDFHPFAKSAPPSPTREHSHPPRDFFRTVDSATQTLRRILNLDIADEEV